jgi:signal transduction histidine kinase
MAHDFNNILCAILGFTELALYDQEIKGLTRDNLQSVHKSAERAKELIKRILTFSRPSESERHPVRLSSVLNEAVKLLNATLPSSIEIKLTIRTEDDIVAADATELHQVIMNLGTNAGHALKQKGGRLEYELDAVDLNVDQAAALSIPAGSYVRLVTRDDGHGMSPEVIERIFEPFFTTKAAGRGTGLG